MEVATIPGQLVKVYWNFSANKKPQAKVMLTIKLKRPKFIILLNHLENVKESPASWFSSNVFASGARGLRFKHLAGQNWTQCWPTARHRCDISSKEAVMPQKAMMWK